MKEKLKEEIERMMGRQIKTPADFDCLSNSVFERTKVQLSTTTLKRLFGYLDEPVNPRLFTLDVLSRFVGYRDYATFCQASGDESSQSNLVLGQSVATDELATGQRLVLSWRPDRRCVVEHLGEGRFVVKESQNSKLNAGDRFTCHLFIAHEPLYLNDLVHNDEAPAVYVAGRKDGILFEIPTHE